MSGRSVAAALLALLVGTALLAPVLGLRDPARQHDPRLLREAPPLTTVWRVADDWFGEDPGGDAVRETFWLGTDRFGRDTLSRLVWGARASLWVGGLAAALALALGALVGGLAGTAGGLVDAVLMRATDLALTVPRLFLAMLLVALHGPGGWTTVWVLGATSWMTAARLVRAEVVRQRALPYVRAARAAGVPRWRIGARHLMPATATVLGVEASLRVGETILLEATLSFLALGVQEPTPSWGNLVRSAQASLPHAWWLALFPGLAIAATVLCCARLSEGASARIGSSRTPRERGNPG